MCTFPQAWQWCLRLMTLKGESQSAQRLADSGRPVSAAIGVGFNRPPTNLTKKKHKYKSLVLSVNRFEGRAGCLKEGIFDFQRTKHTHSLFLRLMVSFNNVRHVSQGCRHCQVSRVFISKVAQS